MKNIKVILILGALFLVASSNAQTLGQMELKKTGRPSGGYGEKKFKKAPKKIFIAEFRVVYQLLYTDEESTSGGSTMGGGYQGGSSASVAIAIESVQKEDLTGTTNKLYKEYIDRLKKAGYEIITADAAADAKPYEGWEKVKGGGLNEAQFRGYIMSTPTDFEYYVKKTTKSGKEKTSFTDNSPKISYHLDEAIVAKVNIVVPFMSDAESQGSKTLTKIAGGVSKIVVAPDFKLSNELLSSGKYSTNYSSTQVMYTYATNKIAAEAIAKTVLEKPLQINGVFENKKYKSISASSTNQNWSGAAVIVVRNKSTSNIQVAKCDADQYKNGIYTAGSKFLNASLDQLQTYVAGK